MILADKILNLRKSNNWSQEELAEKMNVSRQSISKWESAAAIPDINRILDLAKIFGVTTDYLLKDELDDLEYSDTDDQGSGVRISLAQMNDYLMQKEIQGRRIGIGVMLCILSPVVLIVLPNLSNEYAMFSEEVAIGIGLVMLLLMVATAVAILLLSDFQMKRFKYLEEGSFELEYGLEGIVRERQGAYQSRYMLHIVSAVVLLIVCALPLILAAVLEAPEILVIALVGFLMLVVAGAVYLFITAGTIQGSFDRLLNEGEFTVQAIEKEKKSSKFAAVYFPIIAAIYLAWSFTTWDWHITWIIWPIAGATFAALSAIINWEKS